VARPRLHLAASLVVGVGFALARRDARPLIAALAAGVLVDLDHLADYALHRTRAGERYVLVPLHGWELLVLLVPLDRRLRTGGALTGAYLAHLALDQVTNTLRSPWSYFILYRLAHGFRADAVGARDLANAFDWSRAGPRQIGRFL
jgi:hypothetical protein